VLGEKCRRPTEDANGERPREYTDACGFFASWRKSGDAFAEHGVSVSDFSSPHTTLPNESDNDLVSLIP